jgi:hypothetical protein
VVVGKTTAKLNLHWSSDGDSQECYVRDPDPTNTLAATSGTVPLREFTGWYGKRPDYMLARRRWWRKIAQRVVDPGTGFSVEYTTTHGISTTDTSQLSAEVGVEVEGVGVTIQAGFSNSITTSTETTVTNTYPYTGPADATTVWALWQLMEELVALDDNEKVVSWSRGTYAATWAEARGGAKDGALLLAHNQFLIPTETMYVSKTLFPN